MLMYFSHVNILTMYYFDILHFVVYRYRWPQITII